MWYLFRCLTFASIDSPNVFFLTSSRFRWNDAVLWWRMTNVIRFDFTQEAKMPSFQNGQYREIAFLLFRTMRACLDVKIFFFSNSSSLVNWQMWTPDKQWRGMSLSWEKRWFALSCSWLVGSKIWIELSYNRSGDLIWIFSKHLDKSYKFPMASFSWTPFYILTLTVPQFESS